MVNKETPYPKIPIPQGKYRHLERSEEKRGIASGIQTEGNRREGKGRRQS
jgi:hypothetical protein